MEWILSLQLRKDGHMNKYTTAIEEIKEIGFQEFVKDKGNRAVLMSSLLIADDIINNSCKNNYYISSEIDHTAWNKPDALIRVK